MNVTATDRLTIRRISPSDGSDLHAYLSDPAIDTFEPGEPIHEQAAVGRLGYGSRTDTP